MRMNAFGEFVCEDETRTRVRTDAEQLAERVSTLKAQGYGVCDVCGRVFKATYPNQKRCGRFACKQEANRRRARERARRGSDVGVTTMPELYWPLMHLSGETHLMLGRLNTCAICGATWPLNRHHIVFRSQGELYEGGRKLPKPTILLCGSGNATGCHGKAHHRLLHFRNPGDGSLEYLLTDKPVNDLDALKMGGWLKVTDRHSRSIYERIDEMMRQGMGAAEAIRELGIDELG